MSGLLHGVENKVARKRWVSTVYVCGFCICLSERVMIVSM